MITNTIFITRCCVCFWFFFFFFFAAVFVFVVQPVAMVTFSIASGPLDPWLMHVCAALNLFIVLKCAIKILRPKATHRWVVASTLASHPDNRYHIICMIYDWLESNSTNFMSRLTIATELKRILNENGYLEKSDSWASRALNIRMRLILISEFVWWDGARVTRCVCDNER